MENLCCAFNPPIGHSQPLHGTGDPLSSGLYDRLPSNCRGCAMAYTIIERCSDGCFAISRHVSSAMDCSILRPLLFALSLAIPGTFWSTWAIFLVFFYGAFHLKLEPYKAYILDQLDFALLACLCVIALSGLHSSSHATSSTMGASGSAARVFVGRLAALVVMHHELRLKAPRWLAKNSLAAKEAATALRYFTWSASLSAQKNVFKRPRSNPPALDAWLLGLAAESPGPGTLTRSTLSSDFVTGRGHMLDHMHRLCGNVCLFKFRS